MFSHTINNPNNFVIKNNNYTVIPFGHRCTSALACKFAGIRSASFPFDWTIPVFPNKIKKVLENNFEDFIPDVHNGIFHSKYGFVLAHFNPSLTLGIEEYKRRIDRFKTVISQPKKIHFVYINEDYLYNISYREDKFNDDNFNDMLELEKFMKDTYVNIDYNILYFNFKRHTIPTNSNIINIVLHTSSTNLNNIAKGAPFGQLRIYCGKILASLFSTNLNVQFNNNMFYD